MYEMIEKQKKKWGEKKGWCSFPLAWTTLVALRRGSYSWSQSLSGPCLFLACFPRPSPNSVARWILPIHFFVGFSHPDSTSVIYRNIYLSNLTPLFYARTSRNPQTLRYLPNDTWFINGDIGLRIWIFWFQGWTGGIGLPLSNGSYVFSSTLMWSPRYFWKLGL